jgi:hypothetical protein
MRECGAIREERIGLAVGRKLLDGYVELEVAGVQKFPEANMKSLSGLFVAV